MLATDTWALRGPPARRAVRRRAPARRRRPRAGPGDARPAARRADGAPRHRPPGGGARSSCARSARGDGKAVLAVVHDLTLAAQYCDRLVMLRGGVGGRDGRAGGRAGRGAAARGLRRAGGRLPAPGDRAARCGAGRRRLDWRRDAGRRRRPNRMIYTRSGDAARPALFGGGRVPKDHPRVAAYGAVDELNSALGVAIAFMTDHRLERRAVVDPERAVQHRRGAGQRVRRTRRPPTSRACSPMPTRRSRRLER